MKCEVCLELLEEYLDGEIEAADRAQIDAHLVTCTECSENFGALTAEQEIFARYDRELEVPPFMWTRVAAHTVSESKVAKRGWFAILFRKPCKCDCTVVVNGSNRSRLLINEAQDSSSGCSKNTVRHSKPKSGSKIRRIRGAET